MRGRHGVRSLIRKELQEAMRGVSSKGDPKVNFLLSLIRREAAARALGHGAHPLVVGSSCFERHATGAKEGPMLCPKTPRGKPLPLRDVKEKRTSEVWKAKCCGLYQSLQEGLEMA
jgi:hypothetical protein